MNTTPRPVNYDEHTVPPFVLPDPLVMANGKPVSSPSGWPTRRRELLDLFRHHVYGRCPPAPAHVPFTVTSVDPQALGGRATRKEISLFPTGSPDGPRMDLLVYLPNGARGPVPAFMGLNFRGNHTTQPDPGIMLSASWSRFRPHLELESKETGTAESLRGVRQGRWPATELVTRGYALATAFYGDIEPDFPEGWRHGVRGALADSFPPGDDTWGAIGAWAWGLSRALDVLSEDVAIDAKRVAVLGHSRLGKTALWAAAQDERFAMAISNNSGCGGASLSRHTVGESVALINAGFPHWFCQNYKRYNDHESALPIDQHELLALIAPRPVYVASATEDRWCDPLGEFLAARHASAVYEFLGLAGLRAQESPLPDTGIGGHVGYHIRTGPHDVTPADWAHFLSFADRHLRRG